jgi:amino acid adenylation domain-containing protein
MELALPKRTDLAPFWKPLFSDLENAGFLRESGPLGGEGRTGILTAQIGLGLVLSKRIAGSIGMPTLLRAAWAVVLARHTSNPDVVFLTSFGEQKPWLGLVRTLVPARSAVSSWLELFGAWLKEAGEQGPLSADFFAQARKEGFAYRLPAFLIVPAGAKTFVPREQIEGPLMVVVRLDTLRIELHYDAARLDKAEVQALGDHLNIVLRAMAEMPACEIGRLPLLTELEHTQLLDRWNDTEVPFDEDTCVHQFFEEQAARTPDAIAVVFCDQQWTYRELDVQAEKLAGRLRGAGVGPGTFVAICLNRSLELMATLFAVFKAGGAYVPLDPSYPAERLAFMIEDARPTVIVVSKQTAPLFALPGARLFFVDGPENEPIHVAIKGNPTPLQNSDAAYVLYTSGSTGKPKGVIVTHRNVSNFFTAMDSVIGTETGVWLAVTSINFDISVFELFWTMARGFRVILQEEGQWVSQSGSRFSLPEQMRRHGVTHLQCTPSLASMLICDSESVQALRQLKRFMVGGEPLPLDLAHRLGEIIAGDLFNLYGPTETTVWSASQRVARQERQILIGRPVANNRLYVLDAERQLAPIGSVGELYIGGAGLAREYLNRPDVTAERFILHSFSPTRTERLYRTGDLVRYARDGRLEFVGRIDQQIKIRGVRIELGEIEMVLREHREIRDAVVVVQEDEKDDKRLVAYVIAATAHAPTVALLLQWLGTKLPKPLVPSTIIFLTEFPKTPNGKLDRRALPKPDQRPVHLDMEGAANELERQIASIWADALGVSSVGLEDRFFDIGGHSLLMVEVHDQLRDRMGQQVALLDLFQYPTVRSLARHLQNADLTKSGATGLNRGKMRQQLAARHNALRNTIATSS